MTRPMSSAATTSRTVTSPVSRSTSTSATAEAHPKTGYASPVYVASRDEIVELVGEPIYDLMVEQLERADWVPIAHPTVRAKERRKR